MPSVTRLETMLAVGGAPSVVVEAMLQAREAGAAHFVVAIEHE
jgi:hypothetical protein